MGIKEHKITNIRSYRSFNITNTFSMVTIIILGILMIHISIITSAVYVNAEWSPDTNELGPTKDTYISIGGSLGDPAANYGLANNLDVGKGFNGVCISAIQFDLSQQQLQLSQFSTSEDSYELESLIFKSDVSVYGDNTREIKVSIILNHDWEELSVTGFDNPFNATELSILSFANLTSITIGGSTAEIIIDLGDYLEYRGVLTLIFTPELTDDGWMTMSSRENEYLYSFSEPPRLVYSIKESAFLNIPSSDLQIAGLVAVIGIIIVVFLIKRANRPININH